MTRPHGFINAFNVINPLIPFANIALALDDDDWASVGYTAVSVGVTILRSRSAVAGRLARSRYGRCAMFLQFVEIAPDLRIEVMG
jgi:hypothetical protein